MSTAIVTGAAGAIGAAIGRALADSGFVPVGFDRAPVGPAFGYSRTVDVTEPAQIDQAVAAVEAEVGPIHVLVNAAGVLTTAPALDTTDAEWASALAVNATGVFVVSRAVARVMAPRRRGSIVTVASNAGAVPRAGMAAYSASKAAAAAFTKVLGLELAGRGIRCNVVTPGSTDTAMLRGMAPDLPADEIAANLVAGDLAAFKLGIPLGRIAAPADIAAAVQFLVSDAARHITMHDLRVDGGATLGA